MFFLARTLALLFLLLPSRFIPPLMERGSPNRTTCILCPPGKTAQKTDPKTSLRYCCVCFHDVRPDLNAFSFSSRCFACLMLAPDITEYACTWPHREEEQCCSVWLCSNCHSFHDFVLCPVCWARVWDTNGGQHGKSCYRCQGYVDSVSVVQSRLCHDCRHGSLKCYFCLGVDNVVVQPCQHLDLACTRRTPMCRTCKTLHDKAVCPKCWAKDWRGRCFKCRRAQPQSDHGRFCDACYRAHSDEGARQTMMIESVQIKLRLEGFTVQHWQEDGGCEYMRIARLFKTFRLGQRIEMETGPTTLDKQFWDRLAEAVL